MVVEVRTENGTVPPSEVVPPVESNVAIQGEVAQPPVETQEHQPAPVTPEPTPAELLTSARTKITQFEQAKRPTLDLTIAENRELRAATDRENSQRDLDAQIARQQQEFSDRASKTFDSGIANLASHFETVLADLGIPSENLSRLQSDAVKQGIEKAITGIRDGITPAITEPLRVYEAGQLASTMKTMGYSQPEIDRHVNSLPIQSIPEAAFKLGYEQGQRAGVTAGSVVKTQAEWDTAIREAESRGEELAKSGGRPTPPGAGGGATIASTPWLTTQQIDSMNTNEWLGHTKEWRDAQRTHALEADSKARYRQ